MKSSGTKLPCLIAVAILIASAAVAQNQQTSAAMQDGPSPSDGGSSLAAAARSAKAQKTSHAKKVFTDEDIDVKAGPLPRMKMDGAENGDEIVAAITSYKATHTEEQTEAAVRTWYDRYDEMLVAAIEENRGMATVNSVNMSNAIEFCQQGQDYQQCQSRQMSEQRGSRSDQNQMMKNNVLVMRIQRVFMKVRSGLQMNNLHYSWYKIQNNAINGDDL